MNQKEFFERVLRALERLEIPYMVTGSVGAILFGEPRLTNDMDVVVELPVDAVEPLASAFPPSEFYLPPREAMLSEIEARAQFNLIHVGSGSKVDLILRKDRTFSRTEFARRIRVPFSDGFDATSATPEDIILSKLEYYRMGESQKHLEDVRGMLRVSGRHLDMRYTREWAGKLGLLDILDELQGTGPRK
jgi:hypothetical protein